MYILEIFQHTVLAMYTLNIDTKMCIIQKIQADTFLIHALDLYLPMLNLRYVVSP